MKENLSILLPTFNDACFTLVEDLRKQAEDIEGLNYEILVGDDGSTSSDVLETNRAINHLPHCKVLESGINRGRAAIRNVLAKAAQYEWLLYVDSDMTVIRPSFLINYLASPPSHLIIYGGYEVGKGSRSNLRYCYEQKNAPLHTADKRKLNPWLDFHTSNFMVRRNIMLAHPLDEQFVHYGYEDVVYGKQLREAGYTIHHIDNPLGFCTFEDNHHFRMKTEEGLRTLHAFSNLLEGYSRLLKAVALINRFHMRFPILIIFKLLRGMCIRNLEGKHPSLKVFSLYRLGYFLSLRTTE